MKFHAIGIIEVNDLVTMPPPPPLGGKVVSRTKYAKYNGLLPANLPANWREGRPFLAGE